MCSRPTSHIAATDERQDSGRGQPCEGILTVIFMVPPSGCQPPTSTFKAFQGTRRVRRVDFLWPGFVVKMLCLFIYLLSLLLLVGSSVFDSDSS